MLLLWPLDCFFFHICNVTYNHHYAFSSFISSSRERCVYISGPRHVLKQIFWKIWSDSKKRGLSGIKVIFYHSETPCFHYSRGVFLPPQQASAAFRLIRVRKKQTKTKTRGMWTLSDKTWFMGFVQYAFYRIYVLRNVLMRLLWFNLQYFMLTEPADPCI